MPSRGPTGDCWQASLVGAVLPGLPVVSPMAALFCDTNGQYSTGFVAMETEKARFFELVLITEPDKTGGVKSPSIDFAHLWTKRGAACP